MNKAKILIITLLALMLIVSAFCSGTSAENSSSDENNSNTITVSTAEELLNEIASNKTIMLKDGEYMFSEELIDKIDNEHITYDDMIYGYIITGVENLKIRGTSKESTQLLTKASHIPVLSFEECNNIELSNFTSGHVAEVDYCMGCVLSFVGCSDVTVSNTDLFGSGLFGFYLDNTNNFNFIKSTVYGCSDSIIMAVYSNDITIIDSHFKENIGSFIIGSCTNFLIKDTSITNNSGDNSLFMVSSYGEDDLEPIKVENSFISDNYYPSLEQEEGTVIFDEKTQINWIEETEDLPMPEGK